MQKNIHKENRMKILLIDLNSGKYLDEHEGHEKLNFEENNGMFYGYAPPNDKINIKRLGANKDQNCVENILVVYVKALSKRNRNREIVAFCKNATVFGTPQDGKNLGREIEKINGHPCYATYSIQSDNLTKINQDDERFTIDIKKYNVYMFRNQRSYLEHFSELEKEITAYIKGFDGDYSYKIQIARPATLEEADKYSKEDDVVVTTKNDKHIKRNPSIGKLVIESNNFQCLICAEHVSFKNREEKQYMEAHHVIPCTVENSAKYKGKSKLDRVENIVSLCPNCHKAVHLGSEDVKKKHLKIIYDKQIQYMKSIGLDISFDELLELY